MGEMKNAVDVLEALLEKNKSPLAADFKRYRLKLEWLSVAGEGIAEKCSPVAYSHGILYIWVTSAVWLNQLFFIRTELLRKVNMYNGAGWAKEIRFTQDKKDLPPETPDKRPL